MTLILYLIYSLEGQYIGGTEEFERKQSIAGDTVTMEHRTDGMNTERADGWLRLAFEKAGTRTESGGFIFGKINSGEIKFED